MQVLTTVYRIRYTGTFQKNESLSIGRKDPMYAVASASHRRRDAREKIAGTLRYLDDIAFDGLYGAIVRSGIARGTLKRLVFDEGYDWSGVTIVTADDIPGENVCPGLMDDQPFLCKGEIRFYGEPVALIACTERARLDDVLAYIRIESDPLSPVLELTESSANRITIFGEDNSYKTIRIGKGDTKPVFADPSMRIVSGIYETPAQEHLYLEPQGMEALHHEGRIVVRGSMQCPGYVSGALKRLCGYEVEVEQTPTGGGFGGKEDYPSLVAAYAWLLAHKSGQNVRLVYERGEDMAYTTKRHPARITYRTALDPNGTIAAMEVTFDIDAGAYCTLSPVVLSRGALHCCGLYEIPSVSVHARALATNTPPSGAFRGFGAPQAIFALERHMDELAETIGDEPLNFRRRHLPHDHSTTLTSAHLREAAALSALFERGVRESNYVRRKAAIESSISRIRRGIGMALFMHGGGFTGSGESFLASRVRLELEEDGTVTIRIISTEMGQGGSTVLAMLVAQELEISSELVHYATPNTFTGSNSGPTVASRTTMVVGDLLRKAARRLKGELREYRGDEEFCDAVKFYCTRNAQRLFEETFVLPDGKIWDEEHYLGEAYLGYSLGLMVAEVAIDPLDYRIRVTDMVALCDIGRVVNPLLAQGQVYGGIAQGIGYALSEELFYRDGRLLNPRVSDYMIPTAADMPPMHVGFMPSTEDQKGLGELPMDGAGAAVANAVAHALGRPIHSLPITAQKVMEAWR